MCKLVIEVLDIFNQTLFTVYTVFQSQNPEPIWKQIQLWECFVEPGADDLSVRWTLYEGKLGSADVHSFYSFVGRI